MLFFIQISTTIGGGPLIRIGFLTLETSGPNVFGNVVNVCMRFRPNERNHRRLGLAERVSGRTLSPKTAVPTKTQFTTRFVYTQKHMVILRFLLNVRNERVCYYVKRTKLLFHCT